MTSPDVDVVIDFEAVEEFFQSEAIKATVMDAAVDPTRRAQAAAPKATGAGGQSIHSEPYLDRRDKEWQARIGWERVYFYMVFGEIGTRHRPARPFLVPALTE